MAQRRRAGRVRDALIWGAALGAGAGAVLVEPAWLGAAIGLATVGPLTALAKPGALWGRILHSALLMALVGALLGLVRVHPLIREFYEHTSRFTLSIVPEWRTWMKPVYELFKRVVAEPLGQAAIPSNIEQAQRGMVSTIDTISLRGDVPADALTRSPPERRAPDSMSEEIDIRGWIRTFADSGKPIYVGIYTSFRHDGRGYVSVGFPIPSSNFTATLEPHNVDGDGLLLSSRSALEYPGHYLSAVEGDALTVLKLLAFHERIHVHVDGGELKTEHSFSLAGQRFLTLHYEIDRR